MPGIRFLLVALPLVLLAGCGGAGGPADQAAAALCPRVAIIGGLESLQRPAAAPEADVAYRAALENIDGECRAEGDDLVVAITLDVLVQPGPALQDRTVRLPYFVAVSAPGGDVLARQDFVAEVDLAPGARRGGVTETFTQRFAGREAGAAGYQVLFGFALPADEALRQRRGGL